MKTSNVNISKRFYAELLGATNELPLVREALAASIKERDNIRKAYEEVNERTLVIQRQLDVAIFDLTRQLENKEASNHQLAQNHAKLEKVAGELALEKETLANALASMWTRFDELMGKYAAATGHK